MDAQRKALDKDDQFKVEQSQLQAGGTSHPAGCLPPIPQLLELYQLCPNWVRMIRDARALAAKVFSIQDLEEQLQWRENDLFRLRQNAVTVLFGTCVKRGKARDQNALSLYQRCNALDTTGTGMWIPLAKLGWHDLSPANPTVLSISLMTDHLR